MGVATPRWSDCRFSYFTSGFRAFDVIATSEADAIASSGVFQSGSTHPLDRSLIADPPEATADGFGKWIVSCNFKPTGQQHDRQKARIRWRRGETSEPYDRDPDGNPILNSAYDLFDPPQEVTVAHRFFSIVRLEVFYDLPKAEKFENTVNDSDFTFLGRYDFKKGQIRCESILPTEQYAFDANLIEIEYAFEIRRDGWRRRLVDQGRRAFYNDGAKNLKIPLYGPDHQPVASDVPLDGSGAPLDNNSFTVGPDNKAPARQSLPKGAELEKGDKLYFLTYKRLPDAPFAGLEL